MAIRASNQITFSEQKRIVEIKEWYLAIDSDNILTTDETPQTAVEGDLWFNKNSSDNSTRLMQFIENEWVPCPTPFNTSMQKTSSTAKYLWNYEEVIYSIGAPEVSIPVIIGTYGSISEIKNYYAVSEMPMAPKLDGNAWTTNFGNEIIDKLSSVNKYLWNYEIIIYADGHTSEPHPAIIGIYGDSGEDAVSFKIYSENGYMFVDDMNEENRLETVMLRLAAFKGNKPLEECTYTWYWYDRNNIVYNEMAVTPETIGDCWVFEDGEYVSKVLPDDYNPNMVYYYTSIEPTYKQILETTDTFFEVNMYDEYAFATLKCEMKLKDEDNPYMDSITLSKKVDTYHASISFFEGSNVFAPGEDYLIAYVDLYKNGEIEEELPTTTYYSTPVNLYAIDESVDESTTGTYYVLENNKYIAKTLPQDGFDGTAIYYQLVNDSRFYVVDKSVNENTRGEYYIFDGNSYTQVILTGDDTGDKFDSTALYYRDDGIDGKIKFIDTDHKPEAYIVDESVDEYTIGSYYILKDGEYIKVQLPDDGYDKTITYYTYQNDVYLTYFICATDGNYNVVLGEYDFNTNKWYDANYVTQYIYSSSSTALNNISNIFVISKSDVVRSQDINIYIYAANTFQTFAVEADTSLAFIATAKATVVDLNDTIVSGAAPENPYEGQLWLNTNDNTLYVYTNDAWKESIKQAEGQAVHTSKPSNYKKGDLWIVSADDAIEFGTGSSFTEGSTWKAQNNRSNDVGFVADDWVDVNKTLTQMQKDVKHYFGFDPSYGVRIKSDDGKFWTQVDSKRTGFYYDGVIDEMEIDMTLNDKEVAYIGTNSARLRNLVVEKSANFKNPISVESQISMVNTNSTASTNAGFNFVIEGDGSFSLVRVEVQ